jgi:putative ABC transport system ATP-binding protein
MNEKNNQSPSLKVTKIVKNFMSGDKTLEILKNISFEIKKGEKVAIWGPSGSGKTTLISLLAGLDGPTSGEIQILGERTNHFTQNDWTLFRAKNIGFVFQQYHLIEHLNVIENVILPVQILGGEKYNSHFLFNAQELLEKVGLFSSLDPQKNRIHHYPSQLSGGESQRVALARAMMTRPQIIFADEPSGSLDKETGNLVMTLLFNLVEETKATLVLVTHNEVLANKCDRIFQIDGGKLLEKGI